MENESEPASEVEEDDSDLHEVPDAPPTERSLMDDRALPIRAKPLFHNNNEDVEEFPLFETKDGLKSTSIVVGEGLFRIVTTAIHADGHPRIDVKLAMDSELTGFQHVIEKPTRLELGFSLGLASFGVLLLVFQGMAGFGFLGAAMLLIGLKYLPNQIERHKLIFSSCGNSHEIGIGALGSFLPTFRASMALVGPAMAEYIQFGRLDTTLINNLHAELRAPTLPEPIPQINQQLLSPPASISTPPVEVMPSVEDTQQIVEDEPLESENKQDDQGVEQNLLSQAGPPVTVPATVEPATPLPPPISPPTGPPVATPPPVAMAIPPPPAMVPPKPAPMPPPIAPLPMKPPTLGQPVPLDAPMPEAPRIAVQATPSDEPLISQEEQDALLDELS